MLDARPVDLEDLETENMLQRTSLTPEVGYHTKTSGHRKVMYPCTA